MYVICNGHSASNFWGNLESLLHIALENHEKSIIWMMYFLLVQDDFGLASFGILSQFPAKSRTGIFLKRSPKLGNFVWNVLQTMSPLSSLPIRATRVCVRQMRQPKPRSQRWKRPEKHILSRDDFKLGGGFNYFCFQPYLGKIPFLTNIFRVETTNQSTV